MCQVGIGTNSQHHVIFIYCFLQLFYGFFLDSDVCLTHMLFITLLNAPRGPFEDLQSSLVKYSSLQNFALQTLAILASLDFQLLLLGSGSWLMCHCLKTPSRSKPYGILGICFPSLKYHEMQTKLG